jgi:ectoine hydroxylase-related dioxygenase (phytanoyl-CoA dioxygenase family)
MRIYLEYQEPSKIQLREWMDFFHQNGFLVIRNVLSPEKCQQLKQDLERDIQQYATETGRKTNFVHRMFELSQANLELFDLEPIVTFAKRLVGHKYYPFINYQMPEHCYQNANPRLKRLLGFLSHGAYG